MKRSRCPRPTGRRAAVVAGALMVSACGTTLPPPGSTATPSDPPEVEIGYGAQAAEEVTGAVVSIRTDEIDREITSFEDLFQGVAGVTVRRLSTGGISIRIRGSSSLSSDAEPLFVINGVPIRAAPGQALMGVDPRDVTRVDVLKDAGATSIYGSRGANGVILLFTTPRDAPLAAVRRGGRGRRRSEPAETRGPARFVAAGCDFLASAQYGKVASFNVAGSRLFHSERVTESVSRRGRWELPLHSLGSRGKT